MPFLVKNPGWTDCEVKPETWAHPPAIVTQPRLSLSVPLPAHFPRAMLLTECIAPSPLISL